MYSFALLALLAGSEYAIVQAAQIGRRQSDTPVALWAACNFPSEGINGPLPCASGSECICKDNSMYEASLVPSSESRSRMLTQW